jgi:membrane AbrB-like protein
VKLKIPGGTIIGPMVLGAFAYGLGLIHTRPPTEVINLIQLILGTTVGFIFVGVTCKEMFTVLVQTLGYFMILVVISTGFIAVVHGMTDFPLLSILLAFAPGGQAEMNLIAIVVGANLPYVALHHIVRLFLVMGIAPILIRFVKKP